MGPQRRALEDALRLLVERCPRLARRCYWAGTSAIALEELGHRDSFDLDFHTRRALEDVRPILSEITKSFGGSFAVVQSPAGRDSGFSGVLTLPGGEKIAVEVLSNFEDVPAADLTSSRIIPSLKRVSLLRYLADKVQCVAERSEARDLVDIGATLERHPELEPACRRALAAQDALLIVERLGSWSDAAIASDLQNYPDVDPAAARSVRDRLLAWLSAQARCPEADK